MNPKTRILFVDDERNILSAMRRVLFGYDEFVPAFALSGKDGLKILEKDEYHVVVSDQKMPEMQGSEFLEIVSNKFPNTIRLLLTGYSDIEMAISAINKGKIFAYLRKPMENQELIAQLKKAADYYWLQEQNRRLLEEVKEKNLLLEDMNQNLEKRIKERTLLLIEKNQQLMKASKKLKYSLDNLIKMSLSFLELSIPKVAQHSVRVAKLCKSLSKKFKLSEEDTKILENSALLHDIGKIGIPDKVASKAFFRITAPHEKELIRLHPEYAVSLLSNVEELKPILSPILFHHENFDGSGFPEGLRGEKIPYLARLLSIANMYDIIKQEKFTSATLQSEYIEDYFKKTRGKMFDPDLIDKIFEFKQEIFSKSAENIQIKEVGLYGLQEGMKLAENIETRNRLLILPKDDILDGVKIRRILNFNNAYGIKEDKVKIYAQDEFSEDSEKFIL